MRDQFTPADKSDAPAGLLAETRGRVRSGYRRNRDQISPWKKGVVLDRDAHLCGYCGFEADAVDHIVPWSFGGSDDFENLVACCGICNCIASNKVFDTFEAKREYVRGKYGPYLAGRLKRILRKLSVCCDCGEIFEPRVKGASAVLCGPCYRKDERGGW